MGAILALLMPTLKTLLDKVIPDPAAKAAAQLQLEQLAQSGELAQLNADMQTALAQIQTNNTEAASHDLFEGGWRPFIGWVCGVAMTYNFIAQPLFAWASAGFWHVPVPPQMDVGTMMPVLLGMLGLAAARTTERIQGVIPPGK